MRSIQPANSLCNSRKKTTEEETQTFRGKRITFIQTNDVRCGNMGLKKVKKHTHMFGIANSELCGWSAAKEKDKKGLKV